MGLEINLQYVHDTEFAEGRIGYSRYGIALANQLRSRGVTVYDDLPPPENVPRRGGEIRQPGEERFSGIANMVCWVSTPSHAHGWYKDQVPVISTMWEFTQLPEQFREQLSEFATIVVPSRQNQELFGLYHPDVRFIPLGIDNKRWRYTPRQDAPFFRFLIGGSGPRKGTDLALAAFKKVFGERVKDPIPQLVMKSPRGYDVGHAERVEVVSGHITDEEEVGLYEMAHCYLQPSRGEGFGLQPLQAIAQGIPTILTNAHGHESFAHLGYPLGWKLVDTGPGASFFGDTGQWWEPDFDELCDQMKYVYEHYDEALAHARHGSQMVTEGMSWWNTTNRFLGEFSDIMGHRTGDRDWYLPSQNLYLTITTKHWAADIGHKSYMWQPGKRYWEAADVKRVLWEAGVLHPDCLLGEGVKPGDPIDIGLSAHQMKQVEKRSGSFSYCPSCHQRLNTTPTHAEDIMAGVSDAGT